MKRTSLAHLAVTAGAIIAGVPAVTAQSGPDRRDPAAMIAYDPQTELARVRGAMSATVKPFRIAGNIYYVGARGIASYLVVTPAGMILIDTGSTTMADTILASIRALGFDPKQVKYILSTHAHFDHVEGHAKIVKATGAKVVALGTDAASLEQGTDLSALGFVGWEPVKVDRVVKDGDTVDLGGVSLRAMWLPGHTPGGTSWFTTASEGGKTYSVMFFVSLTPNAGIDVVNNPRHPNVISDTARSIQRVHALVKPDLVLVGHPDTAFLAKGEAGAKPADFVMTDEQWAQLIRSQRFYDQVFAQTQRAPASAPVQPGK